ncbi:MAG: triphosphoribosyl-dephospho-CoA synthase [Rhizobiaceae bacterium]
MTETTTRDKLRAEYERACRQEIEALKPGNVHVFADGHRMTVDQFITSATVSAAPLTDPTLAPGKRILEAVRATRNAVGVNTNLGILLLAAPLLCAAEATGGVRRNIGVVLRRLDMADTADVFAAIAHAQPGGLGDAGENDAREPPKIGLLEAMGQAAGRDMVARQYVTDFADVFDVGLAALDGAVARGESGMWPTVFAYLAFLTAFPDSHVGRKQGLATAVAVQSQARSVLAALHTRQDESERQAALTQFDRRLKADGINPGTSADLTVAALLVRNLRDNLHIAVVDD